MRLPALALLAAVLSLGTASAAEPSPSSAELARAAMREAMLKQAAMPTRPAVMPMMRPGGTGPGPERIPAPMNKGDAAHKKAMGAGMHDADAVRAEMANRAAHGSGAAGAMMQNGGDMMNAPMMQRSQGMDPGGGMMPGGGGGMGGGGMGPGGMGSGGTMGGATTTTNPSAATPAQPPAVSR